MPAPSLRQLATAVAVKHVRMLDDIGNMPYALVRPILMKVENPEKLHSLELLSPQLAAEDQELWLEFIKRDIPQWDTYDIPEKSNEWYEIYCDLREMVQRAVDADAEQMKRTIEGIQSEKAKLTPKLISGSVPGLRKSRSSHRSGLPPSAQRKANNIFAPQKRDNVMAQPTHSLSSKASQVRQAPLSLVMAHQQPARPPGPKRNERIRVPVVPGRSTPQASSSSTESPRPMSEDKGSSLAEQEAPLKAIATGKPLPAENVGEEHKAQAQAPAKEASPPVKKPIVKRSTISPPVDQSQPASADGNAPPAPEKTAPSNAPPRPPVIRRRPPADPLLRPKQRRRLF